MALSLAAALLVAGVFVGVAGAALILVPVASRVAEVTIMAG